ncbi:MAG TPA: M23 family metallopeptidase [Candidatus Tectomicrobia bacterium]|nr:M23 family metallopeptidase [Candidatus Tectomicrobia bacterium]
MNDAPILARLVRLAVLPVLLLAAVGPAHGHPHVRWHPARAAVGDVVWVHVQGVAPDAIVEGSLAGRSLQFFPYADGQAALAGFDVDLKPGAHAWRLAIVEPGREPRALAGRLTVGARRFSVQRLTVPPSMADLDPETERRAVSEAERLRALYRTITPERLWRGRFVAPVATDKPGTGYGARRVINGKPRAPHTGIDYAAPAGTPVVAANAGRVALVADFFFPGRLVVLDHGLGVYTLYFHLESVSVAQGDLVERAQPIGTVGATGRATGPHLHFGVQVGLARVDPDSLLGLAFVD